jgi:hypothetical protein
VVVVENKCLLVMRIDLTADSLVPRAQITVRNIIGDRLFFAEDDGATPWSILAMRRYNYPLFA